MFMKYPTPGLVKTRLAASIGDEAACEVYRFCAERTLERLRELRDEIDLYVEPPEALEPARAWLGSSWSWHAQQGKTLGQRLAHAIGEAFARGAQRVVAIGSDSPWLAPEHIEEAFEALREADVVIGPAEDGGYYLIGLAHPETALFHDIPWSTSRVLADTIARAKALGLVVRRLGTGYDVDRLADVQRLFAEAHRRSP